MAKPNKKVKVPTIRELLGTVIEKVDLIDKRLLNVESNQKIMMNTPTMKRELNVPKPK